MPRKSSAQLDREIAEALSPHEGMRVVVTASGARKHGLREGAHGVIARVASPDARKGKPSSTARVLVLVPGAEFSTDWPTASLRVAGKGEVDPHAMPTSESSYIGGLRYKAGLKGSHATKKSGTGPSKSPEEVQIRGRTYTVEVVPDDEGPRYVLRGPRGANYTTMRNVNTPHMMFLVNARNFTASSVTDGIWLSDKDGSLKVVRS